MDEVNWALMLSDCPKVPVEFQHLEADSSETETCKAGALFH